LPEEIRSLYNEFIDENVVKRLPKENIFNIGEIKLHFPYKPYASQVDYMTSVVKSLESKTHAALESPTGTGKTLCLLTACLGWLYHYYTKEDSLPKKRI
jgi:regulator of telomere elongation helicase 1